LTTLKQKPLVIATRVVVMKIPKWNKDLWKLRLVNELEKIAAKRGKLDYFKHILIQDVVRDDRNIKSLHAQTLDEVLCS